MIEPSHSSTPAATHPNPRGLMNLVDAFHLIARPAPAPRDLAANALTATLEALAGKIFRSFSRALDTTHREDAIANVMVSLLDGAHLHGNAPLDSDTAVQRYLARMLQNSLRLTLRRERRATTELDAPDPYRPGQTLLDRVPGLPAATDTGRYLAPWFFEVILPRAAVDLGGAELIHTVRLMADVYLRDLPWAIATARAQCKRAALQQRFARTRQRLLAWLDDADLPMLDRQRLHDYVSTELRQRRE